MKTVCAILLFLGISLRSLSDEGMWLPLFLGEQVYADMVKKGLKLGKEQLYSLNKASIKDAMLRINGKFSGSLVSGDGLLFTSFEMSAGLVPGNSANPNGFYARTRQDEIPAKALYADLLLRIEDVSAELEASVSGLTGSERAVKLKSAADALAQKYSDEKNNILAHVGSFFKGNQFLLFVYERFTDLRLVATPPPAIGRFGGEQSEWLWPQFAGNFSLFRIYRNNASYKPKYFLPISLKGFKEGDFSFAYAWPATSNRYESSMGIRLKTEVADPALIKLFTIRKGLLAEAMQKDPGIKTQLEPSFKWLTHEEKFIDGELKSLSRAAFYENRKNEETAFQQWAGGKSEFDKLFRDWNRLYSVWSPYAKHRLYINAGMLGSPLMEFAASLQRVENALVKQNGGNLKQILESANTSRMNFLKAENKSSDAKIMATMTRVFYTDIDKSQHPVGFFESLKGSFGDLRDETSYTKYAAAVFGHTFIFDDAKWNAFVANPDATLLQEDPAFKHVSSFLENWRNKYEVYYKQFLEGDLEAGRIYLKGIAQMDPKKIRFPDADSSLRIVYGPVKSYNPGASIHYDYVCTMKGLLEKQVAGDEFTTLPPSLVELAKKKDYGPYLDKTRNDLVLTFTSSIDLTGVHSGSAVLNANGELIGLLFDRNTESLGNHYGYTPPLDRSICTDIRYVLWCLDKLGTASDVLHELKIIKL